MKRRTQMQSSYISNKTWSLYVDSDAEYLTIPEARSCYVYHFYLINWPSSSPIKPSPERNRPIHTECKKYVMSYPQQLRLKYVES